jgi:N-acetyltransferase
MARSVSLSAVTYRIVSDRTRSNERAADERDQVVADSIVGATRYHDIVAEIGRVEIGYTWYAKRWQRTHVNTACKLLLMTHAFETVGCGVVGLRTDAFNFKSQRAITELGAHKDGVIRHHHPRRDGTVRDSVMFSILSSEWPDVKRYLTSRVARRVTRNDTLRF